ncbi:TPA: hypothetical protein EYP66_08350, partial [Candidatus Poribacteria bacterium]|nr:hypothetical protein [Candidatus Poribacteria bacterium]
MCLLIDVLANNRDNLLLLEIAAFTHDLGKMSEAFLSFNSTLSTELVEGHYLILHRPEQGFYGCQFLHDNRDESGVVISLDCLKQLLSEIRTQYARWKGTNPSPLCYNARKSQKNLILAQAFSRLTPQFSADVRKEFGVLCESGFIAEDFLPEEFVRKLNTLFLPLPPPLNDMDFFLGDILERHDTDYESHIQQRLPINNQKARISLVVKRFRDCDNKDSGADKGRTAELDEVRQDSNICISMAFGEETELIPRSELKRIRIDFSNFLMGILEESLGRTLRKEDWYSLLYPFREKAFDSFSKTLGETRRGANDVTLWDHSYSTASLFKSLLAQILLENEFLRQNPDPTIQEKFKERWEGKGEGKRVLWRILRVNIDSLDLLSKAHKIGDILGYQEAIYGRPERMDGLLNAVKRVVEVDYPLGNEVYRDESGIYFTFPELKEPNWRAQVLEEISQKIYILDEAKGFDVEPLIAISEYPSSFLTIIGNEIQKGYEEIVSFSTQNYPQWVSVWQEWQRDHDAFFRTKIKSRWCKRTCQYNDCLHKGGGRQHQIERCVVCGIRPKCEHQEICSSCEKRRYSRLGYWLRECKKRKGNAPTIWLSEIADINGRVAIITGVFEMSRWLNGKNVESMFTKSPVLYSDYRDYQTAKCRAWTPPGRKLTFGELEDLDFRGLIKRECWDRDEYYRWEKRHYLSFCKHPSPARLRRIWETTQQFFKETVVDIIDEYDYKNDGMRTKRLTLTPRPQPPNLRDAILSIQGMRVDSYWFGGRRKYFLVTENLDWLASQLGVASIDELEAALRTPIGVRLPPEVDREGSEEKYYPMEAALCQDERFQNYKPYTIIHASPLSFIAIVPCADAMGILQKTRNAYEEQFSKVANRLPLSLGAIFFPKRFPLYVALDAARRMMERFRQPASEEEWTVLKKELEEGEKRVVLTLKNVEHPDGGIGDESERTLKVSYKLMEAEKEDVYHPYFFLVRPADGHPAEERRSYFPAPKRFPHPLVHVKELFEGDVVEMLPGYFDFEFIDASEKRFLISYGADGNRRRQLANAFSGKLPYYLHQIDKLKKIWSLLSDERGLTQNQIQNISQELLEKLEKWNLTWEEAEEREVFKKFALNLLKVSDNGNFWKRLKEEGVQNLMLRA